MKSVAIALTVIALLAGCSTSADDGSVTSASASELVRVDRCKADAAAHHITSVTLDGFAVDYPAQDPIAGVHVCAESRDGSNRRCSDTDSDGEVSIKVAPCQDIRVTYTSVGFLGINQLLRIETESPPLGTRMVPIARAQAVGTAIGQTLDLGKAQPIITTWAVDDEPLAGVSVSMTGATGTSWYLDAAEVASTALSSTTSRGIMGFYNSGLGTAEMTASKSGKTCVPISGIAGTAPNSAVVENLAGSIGEAAFRCE
jgi:hypothetical protein